MNPATFELQHSNEPQPKLLDGECATKDWPMPQPKVYKPDPQELTVAQRIALAWDWVMS